MHNSQIVPSGGHQIKHRPLFAAVDSALLFLFVCLFIFYFFFSPANCKQVSSDFGLHSLLYEEIGLSFF